jgi:hypothetical protein
MMNAEEPSSTQEGSSALEKLGSLKKRPEPVKLILTVLMTFLSHRSRTSNPINT